MKRTLSLILALLLCLSLCACDVLSLLNNSKEISPGVAEIDDCIVTITDCKAQINTQTGGIIAVVWVDFTNNSDQTKSLFLPPILKHSKMVLRLKNPPLGGLLGMVLNSVIQMMSYLDIASPLAMLFH